MFMYKPAWQRLLIMVGGVLVNFLLALFIYAMILFTWGREYVPIDKMSHGFKFNETAQQLGFRDGDIPIKADDKAFTLYDANIFRDISEAKTVTVLREGKEVALSLPGDLNLIEMLQSQPRFMDILAPAVIDSVQSGGPAEVVGIKAGDRLLAFNGDSLSTWNEFNQKMGQIRDVLLAQQPTKQGLLSSCSGTVATTVAPIDSAALRRVTAVVLHAGATTPDTLTFDLDKDFRMGIFMHNPMADYPVTTQTYGFLESFPAGVAHGWEVLNGYVADLKYLFTAEGAKSVGSFGAIGSMFPDAWDWHRFWSLTAFISLMLAFMNILPIPALDGGHVLFLLYEVITRRKPSDKFLGIAQSIGMILLFALMGYAIFNDLLRFVF
jgi:regulator of sigma E protease